MSFVKYRFQIFGHDISHALKESSVGSNSVRSSVICWKVRKVRSSVMPGHIHRKIYMTCCAGKPPLGDLSIFAEILHNLCYFQYTFPVIYFVH